MRIEKSCVLAGVIIPSSIDFDLSTEGDCVEMITDFSFQRELEHAGRCSGGGGGGHFLTDCQAVRELWLGNAESGACHM